ncbi:LysR substrate-binding domain-containing protein [Actinocatenispora sera]|uniref:Transcriptional regulator n=1 Tax=Actinocatenispora sera TaxID=390989 RepID=A0A810L2D4_9ACTN|nr:LysR substrate-binding domain-containing protein [Actinocatenispora sera]BCJ29045.1 transcriptional regulator [Actinocatenispora sera]
MNLLHLRSFHAVATEGSFGRAAQRLHISQPTLSEQVRALERSYGVVLFHRTGRRVTLTELGAVLHECTGRLFATADEADQILDDGARLRTGRLRLGADAPMHVMPLLAALRDRYPGVRVALSTGNSEQVLAELVADRVDVALTAAGGHDPRLHAVPVRRDRVVAFVARRHPLGARTEVTLDELAGTQLVIRESGSTTRRVFERALAAAGRSLAEWPELIEVDSREAVHSAVAVGLGVGVVSDAELPPDPRLAVLALPGLDLDLTQYLACRRDASRSRLVRAVFELADTLR